MLGQLVEVKILRNHAVMDGQHGLHQSQHAGGGFGVAEVALDRRQRARPIVAVHRRDAVVLDGVADRGSGAVRLHHADGAGVDPGGGQCRAEDGDLGVLRRGQDVFGAAVLIRGGAADHREHAVTVALSVVEPLEHDDAAPLGAHEAVGRDVERMAATGRRQHALSGRRGVEALIEHQHHTAGERHNALTLVQAAAGLVDSHQARGAGGVSGQRRAVQSERMRDAPGGHAERIAGERVRLIEGAGVAGHHRVVVVRHADEHTGG